MFASEFAWPASEHLCNRLLEGEAIDRLVPQLVVAEQKVQRSEGLKPKHIPRP